MSEKTEQPTPKRIREAREKGDVCKSQDIAPALTVLALALYLAVEARDIFETLKAMLVLPMELFTLPFDEAMAHAVPLVLRSAVLLVLPAVVIVMTVALVSMLAQVGVLFAFKGAMPKLENLDPRKWFQKVFSVKNLFELVKNIVKVLVLAFVVYLVLEKYLPKLFRMPESGAGAMWEVLGEASGSLMLYAAGAFCVIAVLDYLYQRYKYNQGHMMTKDEVRREYKESEGDPQIRSRRKQLHREMLAQNALDNVRRAKVLITNPTHYAVALDYEKDKTPLPIVLAKGEGLLAQRMIEVARQEGIPIMQNVPLAQALYKDGTENAYIPQDLIAPVAEVLRWVQGLGR
ncbi:MAG: type III secretion system export apparatus subunit SctU [Desulfovibrionaceae bacterium]|nr:type III secretion system export apparatus subunit SctU [Desulfovibrionaceae bacterium]